MAKLELLTPEGLRIDGRRAGELRKVHCKLGVFSRADGSAYFQQGNTKVLAAVYGPKEVEAKSKALHDRSIITVEYSTAAFSGNERKKKTKGDRRAMEASLVLRQTFEEAVMTLLYPRSQIDIIIEVVQNDGGALVAAINAATLALVDAGVPMRDFVVACSSAFISATPILDPNYVEDTAGSPQMLVAILPKSNKVVTLQLHNKLPLETMEKVMNLAISGSQLIYQVMQEEVRKTTTQLYQSRGQLPT
jgi:exosome complex component RRP41